MSTPAGVPSALQNILCAVWRVRSFKIDAGYARGPLEKSSSGAEVRGKTLGLVGLGRSASEVASRARLRYGVVALIIHQRKRQRENCPWNWYRSINFCRMRLYLAPHAVSAANEEDDQRRLHCEMKKGVRIVNPLAGSSSRADLAAAIKGGHVPELPWTSFGKPPKIAR